MIEARDLVKEYVIGDTTLRALDGVNVHIGRGEFAAIMGPSGSGKSTFMNIIGCLDRPTSGSYILDGKPVETLSRDDLAGIRNRMLGFVFQGFNLLPRTTALENVELPLYYSGQDGEMEEKAYAALKSVGLAGRERHFSNQLSGGQQQRVAIARALINDPSVILADEPTGNLDSKTSVEIMDIFTKLNAEKGITIILVTHEPDIAQFAARRIHFKDGKIISDERTPSPPAPLPASGEGRRI